MDVDAGRAQVHELRVLAPGDPSYHIVRRGDKLVLWGLAGDTYVLDPDLRSPPRKLTDSWFFIPSAEPDRVWVAVRRPLIPETGYGPATLREVAVDGRTTSPDVRLPDGRYPQAAVGDELVFWDRRTGLELWNSATREVTRRLPEASLGPAQGDLLTWCERDGHLLHVLDVGSGRDEMVAPPQGFVAFDCLTGAFSPDGKTLAIAARAGGYETDRSLELLDLADGVAGTVAGTTVGPQYVFVAWSSGGDRVVFVSGARDDGRQLLQYRLGEARGHSPTGQGARLLRDGGALSGTRLALSALVPASGERRHGRRVAATATGLGDEQHVDRRGPVKRAALAATTPRTRRCRSCRTRNSPSRWRFCPLSPLTVRFRVEPSG